ncbi:MAG TPA: DUF3570 domain-containing protein [Casimicrobiaceae bacterium]|nr:DUF3570 domain-containing protein [Casimicrobiaceae bacterium]
MAATRKRRGRVRPPHGRAAKAQALFAAALALPGVVPSSAHAESAPTEGLFSFSYANYHDWQPSASRMSVQSPTIFMLVPVNDSVAVQGTLVYDAVSGASPYFFNALSRASIGDYRTAGDLKVTKWFGRWAVGVGGAVSSEQDYLSRAFVADARYSTPDNNTTIAFGIGGAYDTINSVNGVAVNEHRHSLEFMVGITQVINAQAIIQSNLTYYDGHGYYSDPYKSLDQRPNNRRTLAWLTRYNQSFTAQDGVLQLSYRFLNDSFGDYSNMFEVAWVQGLPQGWSITPNIRYLAQHGASFYFNPPFPQGFVDGENYTADTRLATWGAFTVGLTATKVFDKGWSAYAKYQFYRQNPDWYIFGNGSPDILNFSARWFELGFSKTF